MLVLLLLHRLDRFRSGLEEFSLSSSSSSSAEEDGEGAKAKEKEITSQQKRKKSGVTVEDLKRNGYRSGPSVLLVREAAEENQSWNWSDGREHAKARKETASERESNREAANQATVFAVKKGIEHSNNLKALQRKEWKEKRKGGIGYSKGQKSKKTKVEEQRG